MCITELFKGLLMANAIRKSPPPCKINVDVIHTFISNRNTGEPKNDDLAATLHLIVICAEQVIGFQRFYLERAQRQTDCAKSVRILTVDSIALLYSMLGAIRGSFVNVTASAVEMLMENSHENLLRLRSDASATVSISTSEEDATKDSRFLLAKLPFEFRMPASYRMEYSSTAVTDMKCSIAPFVAIIDSAMTKLVQVVDLLAGVRATGAHTAKKSSSNAAPAQHAVTLQNESAVREDRATLLTQTIIHVAR